jgi:hypothetical protein
MAGDYSKKTQTDNRHLANGTSARRVHIDGSTATVPVRSGAGRLLRVIINTKGLAFIVSDGSDVIANFATTSPEGTYNYGTYCNQSVKVTGVSGTGSATLVFSD